MKKIIAAAFLSLFIASPALAFTITIPGGTVDCETGIFTDAITSATSTASAQQKSNCAGNGSPEMIVSPWGLTNSQAPHVAPGQTIHDQSGLSFTCPAFFSAQFYCVDITGTEYYKIGARFTAKQMLGLGVSNSYTAYWSTH